MAGGSRRTRGYKRSEPCLSEYVEATRNFCTDVSPAWLRETDVCRVLLHPPKENPPVARKALFVPIPNRTPIQKQPDRTRCQFCRTNCTSFLHLQVLHVLYRALLLCQWHGSAVFSDLLVPLLDKLKVGVGHFSPRFLDVLQRRWGKRPVDLFLYFLTIPAPLLNPPSQIRQ